MSNHGTVRLGDVATYINGYAFKPSDWSDNGLPIIRIQNLTGNDYQTNYYNKEYNPKYLVKKGDVLISWSASLGVFVWKKEDALLNQHIFKVVFDKIDVDKNYFCLAVEYLLKRMGSEVHGSTMKHITKPRFDNTLFPLPDKDTQKQISKKIITVDKLVHKYEVIAQKLDELLKSQFVEMFGNPMENDMEWDMAILDTICDGIGDGLHGTPEYEDNSGYPFINGNNLIDGKITITSTTKFVSCSTYEKHRIDFTDNCILLSINGTLGKVAYYHNEKIMLGKSACYINLKSCVNKTFVFELMRTPFFLRFLDDNSTKSTIKNVGLKAIRGFKLILPPIDVQNQFADFVTKVEQQKANVQKSIEKLETLKKSLMQEYFN